MTWRAPEGVESYLNDDDTTVVSVNPVPLSNLAEMLSERGKRYGDFLTHASITMQLKDVIEATANWPKLSVDKKEALHMIMHKIGRILNGDPDYKDSWDDIAGYATLAANRAGP